MRERKLRSVVNIKGALKQKGVKQKSVKQGLGVFWNSTDCIVLLPSSHFARLLSVVLRKYQDRCCLITGSYGCSTTAADF